MSVFAQFKLISEDVRRRAHQALDDAPVGLVVKIMEPTRSLDQNALLHPVLREVGTALDWKFNGATVDIEDLKSIFMGAYRKTQGQDVRFVIGLDGQPIILNWRTRDLSKKECSDLIEMIYAWRAEHVEAFA